jgi:hydrogenase/urease accessory protein HupE
VLKPVWPAQCNDVDGNLHCGEQGLAGPLRIEGVGERYSAAIVRIYWRDGESVFTLTKGQPEVRLFGSAEDRRSLGEVARAYVVLGVEHILGGIDHLAFVVSLLFLVGFRRQLVWTITAFTAAHSLTLVVSALGWLTLRPPPVEASIALSIMLVAGEALHDRPTLARRWPALVAFLFGLVHGLGFAGALSAIGLPQRHLLPALLTFNVGVEIGQLFVVGLAWLLWRVLRNQPLFQRARKPALYGIGGVAAYWSLARIVAIFA